MSAYDHSPVLNDGIDQLVTWKKGTKYDKRTEFTFSPSEKGCIPYGSDIILDPKKEYIGQYIEEATGLPIAAKAGENTDKLEVAKIRILNAPMRSRDRGYFVDVTDVKSLDVSFLKKGDYCNVLNRKWAYDPESILPATDNVIVPTAPLDGKGRWIREDLAAGLRRSPVDNIVLLKKLPAEDDELRLVTGTGDRYKFKVAGRLTPEETAKVENVDDDVGTGKWILQPRGRIVDFDFQLGNFVHATPNTEKGIYLCDGSSYDDAKLALELTKNPISGFTVTGSTVKTANLKGRYLGSSGGRGISSSIGAIMGSTNKSHTHAIYSGDSTIRYANGTVWAMTYGDRNWQNTRTYANSHVLTNEGSSYARPETVSLPLCIIGGRVLALDESSKIATPVNFSVTGAVSTFNNGKTTAVVYEGVSSYRFVLDVPDGKVIDTISKGSVFNLVTSEILVNSAPGSGDVVVNVTLKDAITGKMKIGTLVSEDLVSRAIPDGNLTINVDTTDCDYIDFIITETTGSKRQFNARMYIIPGVQPHIINTEYDVWHANIKLTTKGNPSVFSCQDVNNEFILAATKVFKYKDLTAVSGKTAAVVSTLLTVTGDATTLNGGKVSMDIYPNSTLYTVVVDMPDGKMISTISEGTVKDARTGEIVVSKSGGGDLAVTVVLKDVPKVLTDGLDLSVPGFVTDTEYLFGATSAPYPLEAVDLPFRVKDQDQADEVAIFVLQKVLAHITGTDNDLYYDAFSNWTLNARRTEKGLTSIPYGRIDIDTNEKFMVPVATDGINIYYFNMKLAGHGDAALLVAGASVTNVRDNESALRTLYDMGNTNAAINQLRTIKKPAPHSFLSSSMANALLLLTPVKLSLNVAAPAGAPPIVAPPVAVTVEPITNLATSVTDSKISATWQVSSSGVRTASVVTLSKADGTVVQTVTGPDGLFTSDALPDGDYVIKIIESDGAGHLSTPVSSSTITVVAPPATSALKIVEAPENTVSAQQNEIQAVYDAMPGNAAPDTVPQEIIDHYTAAPESIANKYVLYLGETKWWYSPDGIAWLVFSGGKQTFSAQISYYVSWKT